MSKKQLCSLIVGLGLSCLSASAIEPGGIIINEVFFNATTSKGHFEAIELLVIADKADLNGLQLSDRDVAGAPSEGTCLLQDLGQGFLNEVPAGTLVVIYFGAGPQDDTNSADHLLQFWTQSSLYCNTSPNAAAFQLGDHGDNIHLLQNERQLDFVKFRASDRPGVGNGEPGSLDWENGRNGFIDVGLYRTNVGFRYLGDKADLNSFPAAWQVYSEPYKIANNLGKPNGARNTKWIQSLRDRTGKPGSTRSD